MTVPNSDDSLQTSDFIKLVSGAYNLMSLAFGYLHVASCLLGIDTLNGSPFLRPSYERWHRCKRVNEYLMAVADMVVKIKSTSLDFRAFDRTIFSELGLLQGISVSATTLSIRHLQDAFFNCGLHVSNKRIWKIISCEATAWGHDSVWINHLEKIDTLEKRWIETTPYPRRALVDRMEREYD